jgi:hypothetical protein
MKPESPEPVNFCTTSYSLKPLERITGMSFHVFPISSNVWVKRAC